MSATAFQMRRRLVQEDTKTEELKDIKTEMTVRQIKEILKEKDIKFDNRANKEQLLELLNLVQEDTKTEE